MGGVGKDALAPSGIAPMADALTDPHNGMVVSVGCSCMGCTPKTRARG
jgi:hypothetical protein